MKTSIEVCHGLIEKISDKVNRLEKERDNLARLLGDALNHVPESYRKPIMEILEKKAQEVDDNSPEKIGGYQPRNDGNNTKNPPKEM